MLKSTCSAFRAGEPDQISVAGGVQARWRRDGKELFYLGPDNRLMAVPMRLDSERTPWRLVRRCHCLLRASAAIPRVERTGSTWSRPMVRAF